MKVNFYDEIRQMITQEFGLNTVEIQKIIREEIHSVVKSMVARAIQQMQEGKSLEIVCAEAVRKEFNSNSWGVSEVVRKAIQEILFQRLKVTVKE